MAKKSRIAIDNETAAEVLFLAARICCVCRQPGKRLQLHHIDEDPSNNEVSNLAALCFDCHDDTQVRGGVGRRLDAAQVRRFRKDHHARIESQRAAVPAAVVDSSTSAERADASEWKRIPPSRVGLRHYIESLPRTRWQAYNAVGEALQGSEADMLSGTYRVVHSLEGILNALASFYSTEVFDREDPRDFISEMIAERFRWHTAIGEPDGLGSLGSLARTLRVGSVLLDLERMVEQMVYCLAESLNDDTQPFIWHEWHARWWRDTDAPPEGYEETMGFVT